MRDKDHAENEGIMNKLKKAITEDFSSEENIEKIESIIFAIILEHIKDLVFLMKVDEGQLRYVFVNDEGVRHAGLPDHYGGMALSDVMDKSTSLHLTEMYKTVIELKEPYSFQDQVKLFDGSLMFGESILTPILNDRGDVIYIISVTRDISDRMLERQKLIESEQRYRSLFDHTNDSILSLNLNGTILSANPAAINLFKRVTISITGKSIFKLFEQNAAATEKLLTEASEGRTFETDVKLTVKSKEWHLHLKTFPIVLNGSVQGIYLFAKDVSDQKRHEALISHMAFHDALTGLLNRTALEKHLKDCLSSEAGSVHALMYIDLDRFKWLNDTAGHSAGDLLLQKVSDRLQSIAAPSFSVYRHGGDEFILLFRNTDKLEATSYAKQILDLFAEPYYLNELVYFVSPSIGISLYPEHGISGEELIAGADLALYEAKHQGRGQFQVFHSGLHHRSKRLLDMDSGLRQAIENDELHLVYQPQINLETGETEGFEALVRWESEVLGNVSPAEFIPAAEESGLIIPIGEWIMEEAFRQLAEWRFEGFGDQCISINLSSKQFQQRNLPEMIRSLLQTYQIMPRQITLEVTESALHHQKEASLALKKLKEIGVRIAIDDFGSGLTSLQSLKTYPVDLLKIDPAFIKGGISDGKDAAVIASIVHFAQSLSLEVLAEGIETENQAEWLLSLNCNRGQGFYFSGPLLPSEITSGFSCSTKKAP